MDETTIKIKEKWVYLYRDVVKSGDIIDFMLSGRREEEVPTMPGWRILTSC
jgi:transposase-like protein